MNEDEETFEVIESQSAGAIDNSRTTLTSPKSNQKNLSGNGDEILRTERMAVSEGCIIETKRSSGDAGDHGQNGTTINLKDFERVSNFCFLSCKQLFEYCS